MKTINIVFLFVFWYVSFSSTAKPDSFMPPVEEPFPKLIIPPIKLKTSGDDAGFGGITSTISGEGSGIISNKNFDEKCK